MLLLHVLGLLIDITTKSIQRKHQNNQKTNIMVFIILEPMHVQQ